MFIMLQINYDIKLSHKITVTVIMDFAGNYIKNKQIKESSFQALRL